MNKYFSKIIITGLVLSLLIVSCTTLDSDVETVSLDNAIQEAARNVENNLEAGTKIAVLYFSSESEAFSEYIIDELTMLLINGKKLVVLDRKYLDQIRNEMDLQLSGDVSDESAQSIGKFLGAQSIVTGSAQKVGNFYRLRFNTIKIETAVREAASSFYLSKNDRQAYDLLAERNNKNSQNTTRATKRSYFVNNGGSGIILALSGLNSNNLPQDELWILNYLQGSIDSIFKKYSNIVILDRSPEGQQRIMDEMEYQFSGLVDDNEVVMVGRLRAANYVIVGTIIKTNNFEYSIQLRIINVETGIQNAAYTLICSLEQIRDTTAIRKISYELFTQMGIIFTENGKKALLEDL
ncbi:MAG: hypothetical protein LBT33_02880 [Spirochaetia bacterium]|jgi:hypothetical protein|nr:hypothetical protein [Spirochaetia bacterium]